MTIQTASWSDSARAAERLAAMALDRGEIEEAAELAAEARAATGIHERRRYAASLRLAAAIACAHPDDARALLSAALSDLGAGMPDPQHPLVRLREDAAFWADVASEAELAEYTAAGLRKLEATPLALGMRKRLLAALFGSLPLADRKAFLARVDPRGHFQGRIS